MTTETKNETKVERHEFAELLDAYTREQLQALCESLLDGEKRMRRELDDLKGIIR